MTLTTAPSSVLPLFFGPPDRQLYGCLHAPRGPRKNAAVLICPSVGYEYMRGHRCLRSLAARLASLGLPILRFDYFGCGDSAGDLEDATFTSWLESVRQAQAFLQEQAGVQQIITIGLRMGAALAAQTGVPGPLVLWEPVVSGGRFLDHMHAAHKKHVARVTKDFGVPPPAVTQELLGFRWSAALLAALESLDLLQASSPPSPDIFIVDNQTQEGCDALQARFTQLGATSHLEKIPQPGVWDAEPHLAALPQQSIARIVHWVQEKCP